MLTEQYATAFMREVLHLRALMSLAPDALRAHLQDQLQRVLEALAAEEGARGGVLRALLDDASLAVTALQFDLEATRRERDALQAQLDSR